MGRFAAPPLLGPCLLGDPGRLGPPTLGLLLEPARFDNPCRLAETGGLGAPGLEGINGLFLTSLIGGLFVDFSLLIGAPTSSRVFPFEGD